MLLLHVLRRPGFRAVLVYSVIALAIIWTLFPFYWAAITSIKRMPDLFGNAWVPWLSFDPVPAFWRRLFALPGLARAMFNSMVVALAAATLATALGVPAGYAVARCPYPNRWRVSAMFVCMGLRVMPPVALVTPFLLLAHETHLRDTLIALVLINTALNLALVVIVMSGVLIELPAQLEEAAWVDGSGRWGSFRGIILPLAAPAVVASWMLAFAFSWNEYLFASALSFTNARTMPELVIATGGGGGVNFQAASSRSLAMMALPLVASLFAQRYIVRGLSLGGVKG